LPEHLAQKPSQKDDLQFVFDLPRCTQGHATLDSGRMIGLSAVKQEYSKLAGFAEVESKIGKGTSFTFHLPLH